MKPANIDADMPVDEIMRRWPATIRVFMRRQMLCIGCPIGTFHTIGDACDAHKLDEEAGAKELLSAMRQDAGATAPSAFDTADAREP